jgi:hypothetical protein
METDVPNNHIDFDDVDQGRLSQLFTLAITQHKGRVPDLSELTAEDSAILTQIVFLLQAIDRSWESKPTELARGRSLFLKKLAAEEPDHPWVRQNEVTTLGDLFRESRDDFSSLPGTVADALSQDRTPIEKLLDVSTRTELLGKALRSAAVPAQSIRDLVMGITRILGEIASISRPQGQGFIYARSQRSVKRKANDEKAGTQDDE